MVKKNSAKDSLAELADDVLFGARVLYRELDDIFGHVSGRIPREAKREGLLFTRMRIAPKPLDPDEVMEIDFTCRRVKGKQHVSGETFIHTEIYKARPEVGGVVHAHPPHVVILSATDRKLETLQSVIHRISRRRAGAGQPIRSIRPKTGREIAEALGQGQGGHPQKSRRGHNRSNRGRGGGDNVSARSRCLCASHCRQRSKTVATRRNLSQGRGSIL